MAKLLKMYRGTITQKDGYRYSVLSVLSTCDMAARLNIYDQLNRKGRSRLLKKWVEHGCDVLEV